MKKVIEVKRAIEVSSLLLKPSLELEKSSRSWGVNPGVVLFAHALQHNLSGTEARDVNISNIRTVTS